MLTLNDAEEQLLKQVVAKSPRGSLPFELNVRLFETPRSACCGATTETMGSVIKFHICSACSGPCNAR